MLVRVLQTIVSVVDVDAGTDEEALSKAETAFNNDEDVSIVKEDMVFEVLK